jgi:RNA polymerase sigma factor (sigma-70 family)
MSNAHFASSLVAAIERVRRGAACQDDWRALFAHFSPKIRRKARRLGPGHEDASDVIQQTYCEFLTAAGRLDTSKGSGGIVNWVFRCALNNARDLLRHRKRYPRLRGGPTTRLKIFAIVPAPQEEPGHVDLEYAQFISEELPDLLHEAEDSARKKWGAEIVERVKAESEDRTWHAFLLARIFELKADEELNAEGVEPYLGMTPTAFHAAVCLVELRLSEELATKKWGAKIVERVKAEIEKKTWRAFLLARISGLEAEVAARYLGISKPSYYQAGCRVGVRLKKIVDDQTSRG